MPSDKLGFSGSYRRHIEYSPRIGPLEISFDKHRYKFRWMVEAVFCRLKDFRRVATRYDRCPETFFSAIMLAATVLFWL